MSEPRPLSKRGHTHGRPSSWTVVGVIIGSVIVGSVALIFDIWPLLYAMAGVFVLGVIGGRVVGIMDDTVTYTEAPKRQYRAPRGSPLKASGPQIEDTEPKTEQLERYMEAPGQRERLATAAHPEAVAGSDGSPERARERLERVRTSAREEAPGTGGEEERRSGPR